MHREMNQEMHVGWRRMFSFLRQPNLKFTLLFMFIVSAAAYNNVPCLIITVSLLYDFYNMSALVNYFYMVMILLAGGFFGVLVGLFLFMCL